MLIVSFRNSSLNGKKIRLKLTDSMSHRFYSSHIIV